MRFRYAGKLLLFLGLTLLPLGIAWSAPAWYAIYSAPQSYYDFADQRRLLGIPNFWNVVSNLPFAIVGWWGLRRARRPAARLLFSGVFLTAFGSAYFHLAPRDATLVWDRIPMTLVFMSLLVIVLGEQWGRRWRDRLLWPLAALGVASVAWWYWTGNVAPYAVVQFGPIVFVLAVMCWNPGVRRLWPALVLYALAKIAELFDRSVYDVLVWSGHTWKHLLAAASTCWIYRWHRYLPDHTASSLPLAPVK